MSDHKDYVITLHGSGRDAKIMAPIAKVFRDDGFEVLNHSYPSTTYPVEQLAKQVYQFVEKSCTDPNRKIHFVGHSLGNLIIRRILQENTITNLGRVVMLAPPNHGTPVADFLKRFKFYKRIYGPAGQELVTGQDGIAAQLPDASGYEAGIIAGNHTVDFLFSWFLLKGPDDGKVTVESTKLVGMKAHVVLPVAHPYLPRNKQVQKQALQFIRQGNFL